MTTIATLAVKLIADVAGFKTTMDEAERKATAWTQSVSASMKTAGGSITDFGGKMTTYATLPILAAGTASLKYASDLEETKNKANVVFGAMSADVLAWSATSDTAMGMSQQKALDAVGVFGAMGQTAGMNAQENVTWSQSLVQLASDWSSFYNLNPVDALNAIQSATAGQYEPLRKMGIVINQTAVEEQALRMGLMQEGGTLSEAARYQALYALMVQQSAAAQGDFARTADGVANQTRIVQAQFENAAATLGQQLLPYATQLLGWISQAITWFQALTPAQQGWIVGILAVIAVIGPLLMIVGGLITAIGTIIGVIGAITTPVLIVIAVIAALIAVAYLLYQAWTNNWGGIQEKTQAAIDFVKGLIDGGMQFISDLTSGKLGWMSQVWNNSMNIIMTVVTTILANIKSFFALFQAALSGDWYRFGEILREIWDRSWKAIGTILSLAWDNFKTIISTAVTNIIAFFRDTDWGQVGTDIVKGIANGIMNSLQWIMDAAIAAAQAALDAAKGFLGISSPSKVFEMQVGWQMAAGTARGWEHGLDRLMAPSFGGLTPAPVLASSGGGMALGGGRTGSVQVVVQHQPLLSLGDRYEAEQVLKPMLQGLLREMGIEVA